MASRKRRSHRTSTSGASRSRERLNAREWSMNQTRHSVSISRLPLLRSMLAMSWSNTRMVEIWCSQRAGSGSFAFLACRASSSMTTSSTHQVNDAAARSYARSTVTGTASRPSSCATWYAATLNFHVSRKPNSRISRVLNTRFVSSRRCTLAS